MPVDEIKNKIQHALNALSEEQLQVVYKVVKKLKSASEAGEDKPHRDLPFIDEINTVKRQAEQHSWKNTDDASLA